MKAGVDPSSNKMDNAYAITSYDKSQIIKKWGKQIHPFYLKGTLEIGCLFVCILVLKVRYLKIVSKVVALDIISIYN